MIRLLKIIFAIIRSFALVVIVLFLLTLRQEAEENRFNDVKTLQSRINFDILPQEVAFESYVRSQEAINFNNTNISADTIYKILSLNRPLLLIGCEIEGPLNFDADTFNIPILIINSRFMEDVSFNKCTFNNNVMISNAVFEGHFSLEKSLLNLTDEMIDVTERLSKNTQQKLRYLQMGNFLIYQSRFYSTFTADSMGFKGQLNINGCKYIDNVKIENCLFEKDADLRINEFNKEFIFSSNNIKENCRFDGSIIKNANMSIPNNAKITFGFAVFENINIHCDSIPQPSAFRGALGLETLDMRLDHLKSLHKGFQELGFVIQTRGISLPINRMLNEQAYYDGYWLESVVKYVFLDLLSGYGFYWERPLIILLYLIGLFVIIYFVIIHVTKYARGFGIKKIYNNEIGEKQEETIFAPELSNGNSRNIRIVSIVIYEIKLLIYALYFSFMNASSMKYKDYEVNKILQSMVGIRYELAPIGFVQKLAELQKFFSVILYSVFILTGIFKILV